MSFSPNLRFQAPLDAHLINVRKVEYVLDGLKADKLVLSITGNRRGEFRSGTHAYSYGLKLVEWGKIDSFTVYKTFSSLHRGERVGKYSVVF